MSTTVDTANLYEFLSELMDENQAALATYKLIENFDIYNRQDFNPGKLLDNLQQIKEQFDEIVEQLEIVLLLNETDPGIGETGDDIRYAVGIPKKEVDDQPQFEYTHGPYVALDDAMVCVPKGGNEYYSYIVKIGTGDTFKKLFKWSMSVSAWTPADDEGRLRILDV